jgi:hypothetical protein
VSVYAAMCMWIVESRDSSEMIEPKDHFPRHDRMRGVGGWMRGTEGGRARARGIGTREMAMRVRPARAGPQRCRVSRAEAANCSWCSPHQLRPPSPANPLPPPPPLSDTETEPPGVARCVPTRERPVYLSRPTVPPRTFLLALLPPAMLLTHRCQVSIKSPPPPPQADGPHEDHLRGRHGLLWRRRQRLLLAPQRGPSSSYPSTLYMLYALYII